jgi:hypothetical protein
VPADAADNAADEGRAEDRRREQDPGDRPDRDPAPGAVLGRLLVLVDVDLAVLVLRDQRDVIAADELRRVQLEQALVVLKAASRSA